MDFVLPNGWDNLKCRSEKYPNFRAPTCICPGDTGVTDSLHKSILEVCYEGETQYSQSSMSVPMKKRCGVGALNNITKENICYCSERSDRATGNRSNMMKKKYTQSATHLNLDFAIWSRIEITNFDYHINFTEPSAMEFKQVKKLLEREVIRERGNSNKSCVTLKLHLTD